MILNALFGILVAIIIVSGFYAYQKRPQLEEVHMLKEYYKDYKESVFSALNDSLEKLKEIELKSTARAGLHSLGTLNSGQKLDVEELKKELKKEIEEEMRHETSSRSVSEQKSRNSVGEAVEATKIRREEVQEVENPQEKVEEESTWYEEPQTQKEQEQEEDDLYLDLENIRIDEEEDEDEDGTEEALELNEDVKDDSYLEDSYSEDEEDWIAELSKDIEKGTEGKVDLQRDLKDNEFSVEELEKELKDSYKKLKEFAK